MNSKNIQTDYYARTAESYDNSHLDTNTDKEHDLALSFLVAIIENLQIKRILDVGAGTGRTLTFVKSKFPHLEIIGVEPVKELREMGYKKGIPENILIDGNGTKLAFPDNSFDLVCEFAVLHHVEQPAQVVSEMLRVSKTAIFISDNNNFGQGGAAARFFKQSLNTLGLWRAFDWIRTRGKGYQISEGDGLFYSYSVFNNLRQIKKACSRVHLLNTNNSDADLYKSASHVALLGVK